MHRLCDRAASLALALTLAACAPEPRALEWEIVLPEDDDRAATIATWEAWIAPGGCPDEVAPRGPVDAAMERDASAPPDAATATSDAAIPRDAGIDAAISDGGATLLYRTAWLATGNASTDAPPRLPPGTYGLVVVGRDAECRPVLAGCRSIDLPRLAGDRARVELKRADGPACEACAGGLCRDPRPAGFRTCTASREAGASCADGADDDCDRGADCLDADCVSEEGGCDACVADTDCGVCRRCDATSGACVVDDDGAACVLADDSIGACGGGTCCVGCVDEGVCAPGTTTTYCGAGGLACAACACASDDTCEAGACIDRGSVAQLAAGDGHACAIDDDGALWCWGDNTSGRLGVGDVDDRAVPTRVLCPVSGGCTWTSVATGHGHACGILEDVMGIVRLACWGSNDSGQLGAGAASTTRPTLVGSGFGNGTHLPIAVDVGDGFTCAVVHLARVAPGVVYCWGAADEGRLGLGAGAIDRTAPGRVVITTDPIADFTDVALGRATACALTSDQRLFCWGANDRGQTGLGAAAGASVVSPVAHPRPEWRAISAGGDHACGAVLPATTTTERVRCWGANDRGQLGLGHLGDRDTPSQLVLAGRRAWTLSAGAQHTCVLEDDATGADDLYCFGENADLRVAASAPDATMPVRIDGGEWRSVAAGGDHTCARGPRGDLWCWGSNDEGQLGRMPGPSEDRARTCL